jgi:hypothetical protein
MALSTLEHPKVVSETELIAKHFMFGPRRRLERQGRLPGTHEDTCPIAAVVISGVRFRPAWRLSR